jgi:two-component sensor histidine kinase/PAS domain-containing protein
MLFPGGMSDDIAKARRGPYREWRQEHLFKPGVLSTGPDRMQVDPKISPAVQNAPLDRLNEELTAVSPDLPENQELLRSVLAGCGDCIKILDLDGRLQFMSEGGKRVMEVDDFLALKGCPWPEFWRDEGNVLAVAAVESARQGRTARFSGAANTARGTPKYWDVQVSPIMGTDGKPAQLLSISRDVTAERHAMDRQRFLLKELEHRVKNNLSIIVAIASRTFHGDEHRAARETFIARVMNLAQANEILTESHWTETPIRRIVDGALVQWSLDKDRFRIAGPQVSLSPKHGLALALALNELGTNAFKYGALSVPEGRVEISWDQTTEDGKQTFGFEWREAGGPAVVAPTRRGFGSRVIRDMMAAEFGGTIQLSFQPSGLSYRLEAPFQKTESEDDQRLLTAI